MLGAPCEDHSAIGFKRKFVCGEASGLSFGQVALLNGSFEAALGDADNGPDRGVAAMALESISDGNEGVFLLKGEVRDDSWSWSTGYIYLSTASDELTQTAPSAADDLLQLVGYATSATTMIFDPSLETLIWS